MESKSSSFFKSIMQSQNYLAMDDSGTKKLAVGVNKAPNQVYIQAHPDDAMSFQSLAIKAKDKIYLLGKDLWEAYSKDLKPYKFYLCQTRKSNYFFLPFKGSLDDQKLDSWNISGHRAIKDARQSWIRLISNMEMGHYDVMFANDQTTVAEWPDKTLDELLEIAFEGRIIQDENNPILRDLRGEI